MGAIWYKRIEFAATMSELAGYKSGLALTRSQLAHHVPEFEEWLDGEDEEMIRIRAEDVEDLFGNLLYALGSANKPGISIPSIALYHKYKANPASLRLYENVMQLFIDWGKNQQGGPLDITQFIELARKTLSPEGLLMALEFVRETLDALHKRPWNAYRKVEWDDATELAGLFDSEKLGSGHGRFFDQRFVDYLSRNFESVDRINWRQFEGLAAEFFDRAGFKVQLGAGRNDDGVDLRVWRSDDPLESPPALLIQCKRQREKVGKVVVKALWADVSHEDADSGLIVTTSALSPGARRVCTARAYPVTEVNRETIKRLIWAMRTPEAGVFMGE